MDTLRLGFFTRLLDDADAAERYRLATEQIVTAERLGFESAWVAQHHFHEWEGGLPAPFVFLGQMAARTGRIRLGTGIVALPLENPIRVAEDAAVLDLLSGGRLELGLGPGGNPTAFATFGQSADERGELFAQHLRTVRAACRGDRLGDGEDRLYPDASGLDGRIWQATFSAEGGARAGAAGDGLMLSRTQPRPADRPGARLDDLQNPIVDAYLAAFPGGRAPRVLASRSVFVADDRREARRLAERGLRRFLQRNPGLAHLATATPDELVAAFDVHVGTAEEVTRSLAADSTLRRVTDLAVQVHSVDPPHPLILRSLELMACEVAPALGWSRPDAARPPVPVAA